MKQKNLFVLDKHDTKVVELFMDLGMPKNLAKTLLYVCQVEECTSADIEQGADLRQPEVSIAMRELRQKGWIRKRDFKKEGKGRPIHIYKFTTQLSDIVKAFEQEKIEEVKSIKNDLAELKNIIKSK